MSNPKDWTRDQGCHKDEYLKKKLYNTKRHKRKEREVNTPIVKRDTGMKRSPRFLSTTEKSQPSR